MGGALFQHAGALTPLSVLHPRGFKGLAGVFMSMGRVVLPPETPALRRNREGEWIIMEEHALDGLPAIEVVDEIGSTNAEMKMRARIGAPHGAALRALVQTAGRGQRAHGWSSPEGGLYLSVVLRPDVPPEMLPGLPVACALGIVGALRDAGARDARLKWPNDVVVGASKLAGILVELGTSPEGVFAVCGVGVNMERPAVPARVGAVAALEPVGLHDVMGAGVPVPSVVELACAVRAGVLSAVELWGRNAGSEGPADGQGPLGALLGEYNAALAFVGEPVVVFAIDGDAVGGGVFEGVDGWGRALVRQTDASIAAYEATDVSIRPR